MAQNTFGKLHEICLEGEQTVLPQLVALAHFDLASLALGDGWENNPADLDWFVDEFPEHPDHDDPKLGVFGRRRMYNSWRWAMIQLIVVCGKQVSDDPFTTLRILGRAAKLSSGLSDLKQPLISAFGDDIALGGITCKEAVAADANLRGSARNRFRRALSCLDKLRELPTVQDLQLLPAAPIGPMPIYRASGRPATSLPPQLAEFCARLGESQKSAVRAVFEIGVSAGHLDEYKDISPEELICPIIYKLLVEAVRVEHPGPTGRIYLARLVKAVRGTNPGLDHPDPWAALGQAVRAVDPDQNLDLLSYLKTRCGDRAPGDLDQVWFDETLSREHSQQNRIQIKRAARLLNALRNYGNGALEESLPAKPILVSEKERQLRNLPEFLQDPFSEWKTYTGVAKRRQNFMRSALACLVDSAGTDDPEQLFSEVTIQAAIDTMVELSDSRREYYRAALVQFGKYCICGPARDWGKLMIEAKWHKFAKDELNSLGALRTQALSGESAVTPDAINKHWADTALSIISAGSSRHRFRHGINVLDRLRSCSGISVNLPSVAIGPLRDVRHLGNIALPETLLRELEDHGRFRGLSRNTCRSIITAITTLYTLSTDRRAFSNPLGKIPFSVIIEKAECEGGVLPSNWHRVKITTQQIEVETSIIWTKKWRALQLLTVDAGISPAKNPVPKIAAIAISDGLSPSQIDREWAWQHERSLRPDLQITWSANVARFDALLGERKIEISGQLLTGPLGPMPRRGMRAKHGIFPLPPGVDEFLEAIGDGLVGFSQKQLNEAAHFVWRFAREAKLFDKHCAPEPEVLFDEAVLTQVFEKVRGDMSSQALREQRRRAGALQFHLRL